MEAQENSECRQITSEEGQSDREEDDGALHLDRDEIRQQNAIRGTQGRAKDLWTTLSKKIPTLQSLDFSDFEKKAIADDYDWYMQNMNRKNFSQTVCNYINAHCLKIQVTGWQQIMSSLNIPLNEKIRGAYCSIDESNLWINSICTHNGWDSKQLTRDVFNVINKLKPKLNTLQFHGPPNSGKTLVAMSIAESCMYYTCNNQLNARTSQFGMQEFIRSRVVVLDEISVGEDFKDKVLLLTGGSDCDTDVKNKQHAIIRRTPVIICYNEHPSRGLMTQDRPLFEKALAARSFIYRFRRFPELEGLTYDRLHPQVWLTRLEACGLLEKSSRLNEGVRKRDGGGDAPALPRQAVPNNDVNNGASTSRNVSIREAGDFGRPLALDSDSSIEGSRSSVGVLGSEDWSDDSSSASIIPGTEEELSSESDEDSDVFLPGNSGLVPRGTGKVRRIISSTTSAGSQASMFGSGDGMSGSESERETRGVGSFSMLPGADRQDVLGQSDAGGMRINGGQTRGERVQLLRRRNGPVPRCGVVEGGPRFPRRRPGVPAAAGELSDSSAKEAEVGPSEPRCDDGSKPAKRVRGSSSGRE